MITILVGDITNHVCDAAKKLNPAARSLTKKTRSIANGTYHTSIGDFSGSIKKFVNFLEQADIIIYSPPPLQWSDYNGVDSNLQKETERYLITLKSFKFLNVLNIDHLLLPQIDTFLKLSDIRKSDNKQLWIAGCSISHGVGVDLSQRYGNILSKKLNIPVSFLTYPGSSIEWAADQILRSDIKSGDIVVWGLTSFERYSFYYGLFDVDYSEHSTDDSMSDCILQINVMTYDQCKKIHDLVPRKAFLYQNAVYRAIINIFQVINYCKKIGACLYLAGVLSDLLHYTVKIENYISLFTGSSYKFAKMLLDFGEDGIHPGPLTHEWYASKILEEIQKT